MNPDSLNLDPNTDPDPIRIQIFDDQKLKEKKYSWNFFDQKLQLSIKDVQATEAFSPQKRTSSTKKIKFINFF